MPQLECIGEFETKEFEEDFAVLFVPFVVVSPPDDDDDDQASSHRYQNHK